MKKRKTKQPTDLTLRNLRALKKRFASLQEEFEFRVTALEDRNLKFGDRIQRLEEKVRTLEDLQPHAPPEPTI